MTMPLIKKIMLWILAAVVVFVLFGIGVGVYISGPKYAGPATDHYDGKKFLNTSGQNAQSLGSVLKWATNRDKGPWEEIKDAQYGEAPPKKANSIRVTFINHSTFLLQVDGINILTDPVYSQRTSPFQWAGPKRMRPPGIRFEDLPPIDYVIISHNHYDHLDDGTVKRLKKEHDPAFITPLGVGAYMETLGIQDITDLDWWQSHRVNDSIEIVSVPAQHFSGRGMLDRDATLWAGYVIRRPNGNVYFAGDTGYDKDMFTEIGDKAGPFALSLIPIGAYLPQWFMSPIHTSPAEAVKVHRDIRSKQSIAIHYGTFPLADDGQTRPIEDLEKALEEQNVPREEFWVMQEGEGRSLVNE